MPVCSFLGHAAVLETNAYEKILKAVESIVQENSEIDFWFYRYGLEFDRAKSFWDLCSDAVLEVKARYPEKLIFRSRVVTDLFREEIIQSFKQDRARSPIGSVDRVISPNFTDPDLNYVVYASYNTMRWVIQRSNHIISYVYAGFDSHVNKLYDFAKKSGAMIHDVTEADLTHPLTTAPIQVP